MLLDVVAFLVDVPLVDGQVVLDPEAFGTPFAHVGPLLADTRVRETSWI